jgi:hypothetical protein
VEARKNWEAARAAAKAEDDAEVKKDWELLIAATAEREELEKKLYNEAHDLEDKMRSQIGDLEQKRSSFENDLRNLAKTERRLKAQLSEMTPFVETPEAIAKMDKGWNAAQLPFDARTKLKITFEFIDTPLEDALTFVSYCIHIPVTLDAAPKVAEGLVNLRVEEMEGMTALEHICKLMNVKLHVDKTAEKITVK